MMDLISILDRNACVLNIPERNKENVLQRISEIASQTDALKNVPADTIFQKLSEREQQGSTGIGNGIAIPHTRMQGIDRFVLFIVTSQRGIDFAAIDHKKVHTFFVLIGPEDKVNEHLKILAAISHVLTSSNAKKEIRSAITTTALYEAFLRNVRIAESDKQQAQKMKALFVILYIDDFFYDILEFFIQEGIEGATVLESSGMGQYISNIPLFASFIGFMNEDKNRSRTIVAMIPEDRLTDIIEGIEEITGNLDKKEGAMIFALDVCFSRGTMKMM
jgi:PTS system nitrogen regulatory IIA component